VSLVEINWHPDNKQLRAFGTGALIASMAIDLLFYLLKGLGPPWLLVIFSAGCAVFLISRISARLTRVIYIGLTTITLPIGLVVSFILLAVFYFLLLTPLALFFRLIGRDTLNRKFEPATKSYWVPYEPPDSLDRYFQQF